MKITMLVLNNFTHDARVHKEAKSLASAGHDVTVIALLDEGLKERESRSGYQIIRIKLFSRRWSNGIITPLIKYLEYAIKIYIHARSHPADVYHAHNANTLLAAWLVSSGSRAKLIYDAHELETGRNFGDSRLSPVYQRLWPLPEKYFIKKADAVITVNESIANELVRIYSISMPIIVMNAPYSDYVIKTDRLREWLDIPKKDKILLYQGRIVSGRGIEILLSAIQQLDDVVGVLLGDGPLLDKLHDEVNSGKMQRVYLPGNIPWDLLGSYTASADLGVVFIEDSCLSYHFALPNKLFEYIHAGLPVIASDLPEITRVVRKYQIGEVVSTKDPSELAEVIDSLLNDVQRFSKYASNTVKASEDFVWDLESQKLQQLYQNLLG